MTLENIMPDAPKHGSIRLLTKAELEALRAERAAFRAELDAHPRITLAIAVAFVAVAAAIVGVILF